jgi:CheY-like chemotaxis protein
MLHFEISDTGVGMSKEQVEKLFDAYSRFNSDENKFIEGTGLGMNITYNLVRMMNGNIDVESELGKGSKLKVNLLQKVENPNEVIGENAIKNLKELRLSSSRQKKAQIVYESMSYGSVLIVDDIESNLFVAKGLLAPYDLSIDTACDGFQAIEKIEDGKIYDIIFMDHMMPQMDGVKTTKIIRDLGYQAPIIALTANAIVGQADVFLQNGFNGFISKPIDIRELNAIINKFIRDKQSPEVKD